MIEFYFVMFWRKSLEKKNKRRADVRKWRVIHNWYGKSSKNKMVEIRGENRRVEDVKASIVGRNIGKK